MIFNLSLTKLWTKKYPSILDFIPGWPSKTPINHTKQPASLRYTSLYVFSVQRFRWGEFAYVWFIVIARDMRRFSRTKIALLVSLDPRKSNPDLLDRCTTESPCTRLRTRGHYKRPGPCRTPSWRKYPLKNPSSAQPKSEVDGYWYIA